MKRLITVVFGFFLLWMIGGALNGTEAGLLLKNGRIITVSDSVMENGDILIRNGKIAAIGRDLAAGSASRIIDLQGGWVMPGIIDSHSHIALEGDVNEMGELISAEVDVRDIINPEDMNIYYALSGGVTTIHTMHGSANPISGRGVVLKLRWGRNAREMIFNGAPLTSKWALGENPKQSNYQAPGQPRFPRTRMGVEAAIRLEFEKAKDYLKLWREYEKKIKTKKGFVPLPPRRDLRLEAVADILNGKYWVRCHAYQAEEMLSIMRLCREYGVKLVSFEHGLEGYRIAPELVQYGVAVTTFADFWGYKWEAFHTLPHSAALMVQGGVLVALNSDDGERMRHLFAEAAKTIRFGGLSEVEALKTITINPAKILGIDRWVGTIEVGKDADLAVFNRHPFNPYTVCQMTFVDGQVCFDRFQYLEGLKKSQEKKQTPDEAGKKEKIAADREVRT
jgi:imidazolonepropionase-like amidohydrolase